jgi:hypothetical protein
MIDISAEHLISLAEVPDAIPRGATGKPVHLSVVYRWVQRGIRGTKLEAIQFGGRRMTSTEAIERFVRALSKKAGLAGGDEPPARTPAARKRSHEKADKNLEAAGW